LPVLDLPFARARVLLILVLLAVSCASALDRAASDYRQTKSDASLDVVARSLHKGMARISVERLLGTSDYSPVEGQYYYSSRRANYGLVVDYRSEGRITDRLQDFTLGAIGE
jgi:hypothetical protein